MKNLILSCLIICQIFANEIVVDVISVIDGDTIKIKSNSVIENIRLIGIDACEVNENSRMYRESKKFGIDPKSHLRLGRKAKDYLTDLLANSKQVKVVFDKTERDQYGRMLGYVYANNVQLNSSLIEKGYVRSYSVYPNIKYKELFEKLQYNAQREKIGIWKIIPEDRYDGK